jgi:uncharacterized surface protein with fasciclin (FAS1) repeats
MNRATIISLAGILSAALIAPAQAANPNVENALARHPELSTFYQALVNTGVINELQPNASYTIFAPRNDAFTRISTNEYPCFYSQICRDQVADVLRNHIVPGQVYLSDAVRAKGGVYSIDNRFISIGEPSRNNYAIDGKNVVRTNDIRGGYIHTLDGVIANEREMAMFEQPRIITQRETVTTTTTAGVPVITYEPTYAPTYAPGNVSQSTTTVTRTTPALTPLQ